MKHLKLFEEISPIRMDDDEKREYERNRLKSIKKEKKEKKEKEKTIEPFQDFGEWDEDEDDFEEEEENNEKIFEKEYNYLKKAHEHAKKYKNSAKTFLIISYDMIDKGYVSQETVEKYISWENVNPTEVMKFYKDKPNNIIKNTILGPIVFNFPKPNFKK